MTDSTTHLVKSARRVLEVIEFFDAEKPWATVTDIARELSYPQSSTSVLLKCLRELGYLYYNRASRSYRLTARAALLGCWAEGGDYRGGRVPHLLDAVAERLDETVVLSTNNVDYAAHDIHVIFGSAPGAVKSRAGGCEPILRSVQGQLVLASYPDEQLRLALHRLNADEEDPDWRVNIAEKFEEMRAMRDRGWAIDSGGGDRAGTVAVLLPRRRGGDRLVLSVVANTEVIEQSGEEFLKVLLEERENRFGSYQHGVKQDNVIALRSHVSDTFVERKAHL